MAREYGTEATETKAKHRNQEPCATKSKPQMQMELGPVPCGDRRVEVRMQTRDHEACCDDDT